MVLAEELAEYVDSIKYKDLPDNVVRETKKRIIDGLGCAIGAFNEEPVKIARKLAENVESTESSSVLGTKIKTSPDIASFVNSIMIRYFDYNDTYLSKEPAHPSDNIGACLSVADAKKSNGKDLITAVALAYEIQCRLCDAADIRHRGWDHVCYGSVSAALAACKLMGLSVEEMTEAVNISLNSHITMRQVRSGKLSMWKGCSFANAARNAVFSALLARNGMTGPSPIFEGDMGFWKQVSGHFELNTKALGGRNEHFKIIDTYIKYFPAEYHSQSAIWCALDIRKRIENIEDIESVHIDSHEAGFTILGNDPAKWNPTTRETADHSLPYIVGRALLEGDINNNTYSEKKFTDPKIIEFMKRIKVKEDKTLSAMYPNSIANRVTVVLKSGNVLSKQVNNPRGHPKNPMSEKELEMKFNNLTKKFLAINHQKKALEALWKLEKVDHVAKIFSSLLVK